MSDLSNIRNLPSTKKPGIQKFLTGRPSPVQQQQIAKEGQVQQQQFFTAREADQAKEQAKAKSQAATKDAPGTKAQKAMRKAADQVKFSPEMKANLKTMRREAIARRSIREGLEGKFLSFMKTEPTLEELRQAARFASASIWDIIKKSSKDEDDEEIALYLLALLMKIHSQYTFEHSERVMEWTVALAEEMGITDDQELDDIAQGAFFRDIGMLGIAINDEDEEAKNEIGGFMRQSRDALMECGNLHDIGKMRIPQSIIEKAAPLTDEEYEIIKTHPLIGVEIVKPYPSLHRSIPGIKHHHEKYNGHGYPDNLVGEDIPLAARIITVTDTFDAMTEDRPYRKALSYNDAIGELLRLAGEQFDPAMVRPFVKVLIKSGVVNPDNIDPDLGLRQVIEDARADAVTETDDYYEDPYEYS